MDIRIFGTLDLRMQEVEGVGHIPSIQRNVMARVPDGGASMVLSDIYLLSEIRNMALGDAFKICYRSGEVDVVDEAVASCQNIAVRAAQRQFKMLSTDITKVFEFLTAIGNNCITPPRVGFTDHTAGEAVLHIENARDIEALRSGPFAEAFVRNWIDMLVLSDNDLAPRSFNKEECVVCEMEQGKADRILAKPLELGSDMFVCDTCKMAMLAELKRKKL